MMRGRRLLGLSVAAATLAAGIAAAAAAQPARTALPVVGGIDLDPGRAQVMAERLQVPWGLGFLPDGSALVTERPTGVVSRIRPGAAPERVTTIAGVRAGGEAGLLGLAVSPTYASDGFIYVCFTTASDIRIARFTLAAPSSQQVIFSGPARSNIHDGGRIKFGPDGMLYAAIGDANVPARSQDRSSLNGKILRITPDGRVPADNPFPGSAVYSLGHRNPQGLTWDTRGRLYAAEFGQNNFDEVNLIVAGGNYGWPTVEGRAGDSRFRDPLVVWEPWEASPSGVAFANGTLFVAALRGERLWTVPLSTSGTAGTPVAELVDTHGRLRAVEVAPDGALWITTSNRDGRGTPTEDDQGRVIDDRVIRFPAVAASPSPSQTASPTPSPTVSPTTLPPPTGSFRLRGVGSGRCLDLLGGVANDGAPAVVRDCNGSSTQVVTSESGQLRIAGKCLDAERNGTVNNTRVIAWRCNGGANQQWTMHADGTIRGVRSGKCLDVTGAAVANDTPVVLWTCRGASHQRWARV